MRKVLLFIIFSLGIMLNCGDNQNIFFDNPELSDPYFFDGKITLTWVNTIDSTDFEGYNVYISKTSDIKDATGDAQILANAIVAQNVGKTDDTVVVSYDKLGDGTLIMDQDSVFIQVRTVTASGVNDNSPTTYKVIPAPTGIGILFTYNKNTTTHSGYGWNSETGEGKDFSTVEVNKDSIDFFVDELPTSGVVTLLSPSNADFITWQGKATNLKILDKWYTPEYPEISGSSVSIDVESVIGFKTEDGYFAKIKIEEIGDTTVQGESLKYIKFNYAFYPNSK